MKKEKSKKTKGIPLIVLIIIIAILAVIVVCSCITLRKNRKLQEIDQSTIHNIEREKAEDIETIDLVYGMDGCDFVEISFESDFSDIIVTSNDELIATAFAQNGIVTIKAVCDTVGETTVNLKYNGIEKNIKVNVKPSCLVNFNTFEGSFVIPQMVVYKGNVIRPEDPIKDGYTFEGWYSNEEFTEEYDFNSEVNSDIMIYAKFQIIE